MNDERIKEIRKQALNFMKFYKISQAGLSRSIGVNTGAFNSFLKANYKGDNVDIANKVFSYVSNYSIKKFKKNTNMFIKTKDTKSVHFVMDMANSEREMAIIYGSPGTGKTMAIKEYCKNHPEALLIEADVYTNTRNFFNDLMNKLNITSKHRDIHSKLIDVRNELQKRDTMIVIDEAEHLPIKCLEMIRRVWDYTNTPIVLVGTRILVKNLMGKNGELAQLYSRIGGKWVMEGLCDEDREYIYQEFADVVKKICGMNFRTSEKLKLRAKKLASMHNSSLNNSHFKEASKMLVIV